MSIARAAYAIASIVLLSACRPEPISKPLVWRRCPDMPCTDPIRPRCHVDTGTCVGCLDDGDCGPDGRCMPASQLCRPRCSATQACAPDAGLCEPDAGACVACLVDSDCPIWSFGDLGPGLVGVCSSNQCAY